MPAQTTATLLIGPVTRMMGGRGTMRAQTVLTLDEGSRASWRIVELNGESSTVCAVADRPQNLLAHGLLAFLATRTSGEFGLAEDTELGSLALRSNNGKRVQTRTSKTTPHALADVLGERVAIVATILPGSTVTAGEVAELAALGVRIELAT
jgi:hypothetical protein